MSGNKSNSKIGPRADLDEKNGYPVEHYYRVARETDLARRPKLYCICNDHADKPTRILLRGRNVETLERLIIAGPCGITAADFKSGTRLAAYIFALRELGCSIETRMEAHEGLYAGRHARYILQSIVKRGGTLKRGGRHD